MNASSSDHPNHAVIQVATGPADGQKRSVPCTFSGVRGKRLTLCAGEPVAVSTAVSVQYEDALFLGEIVTCSGLDGEWNLEVKIEQILTGLQSLMILRERLLSESVPNPLRMLPIGALN